jgi:hypothetical protein
VVQGSIASQEEPNADIVCEIDQQGKLAFELFTMDSEFLLEDLGEHRRTEELIGHCLPPGCLELKALEAKFGRVKLAVYFSLRSKLRERDAALRPLIEWLINDGRYNPLLGDEVSVPQDLRPPVNRVIHYGTSEQFQLMAGAIVTSTTTHALTSLRSKLTKKYPSLPPAELLAYTDKQSWDPYERVKSQIEEIIIDGLGASSFRRVWVADISSDRDTLKFVFPPPESGGPLLQ